MAKRNHKLRDRVLVRMRRICVKLPEAVEGESFGNPAFRAGKRIFAVLDRYRDIDCVFFYVDAGLREVLLETPHFFKAPYDPHGKGICRDLVAIDWGELTKLVVASYKSVALKRMLAALE